MTHSQPLSGKPGTKRRSLKRWSPLPTPPEAISTSEWIMTAVRSAWTALSESSETSPPLPAASAPL
nr:MAG TPA: hypothetical protein [Caudoviricetes sp.]